MRVTNRRMMLPPVQATPKRVGDVVMTGSVMAGLTEAYVKAINEGAVPSIATAWQVPGGESSTTPS
jgi:predicted RecA/RadA family phage recombinase